MLTLEALPERLVEALPNLQLLALADMEPNPALLEDHEDNYSEGHRPVAGRDWWRIIRLDSGPALRRVSDDEGESLARSLVEF